MTNGRNHNRQQTTYPYYYDRDEEDEDEYIDPRQVALTRHQTAAHSRVYRRPNLRPRYDHDYDVRDDTGWGRIARGQELYMDLFEMGELEMEGVGTLMQDIEAEVEEEFDGFFSKMLKVPSRRTTRFHIRQAFQTGSRGRRR